MTSMETAGEILQSKLCGDCLNVLARAKQLEKEGWRQATYPPKQDASDRTDDSIDHKQNRAELNESARSGCVTCKWLLDSLESHSETGLLRGERVLAKPATLRNRPYNNPVSSICKSHYYVDLRCKDISWERYVRGRDLTHITDPERATLIIDSPRSFEVKELGIEEFLRIVRGLGDNPQSNHIWELVRHWIKACKSSHFECSVGLIEMTPPTRILDVQDDHNIRLIQSPTSWAKKAPEYATLSHCWGQTHEPQLNQQTLDQLTTGFPISKLPQTFRDAVVVTKALQIPYLWIDSLCILQDSVDDWQQESMRMGSIYQYCTICIAATAAEDNNSGILGMRKPIQNRPLIHDGLIIQREIFVNANRRHTARTESCERIQLLATQMIDKAPLNRRAWVLQERMLAPRVLHCTSEEFIWECCKGLKSETHLAFAEGGNAAKQTWRDIVYRAFPPIIPSLARRMEIQILLNHLEQWSRLIEMYSGAKLTHFNDKLVACSAIAKLFHPRLGNYSAGLWTRYLSSQLLWRHSPSCGIAEGSSHSMRPRQRPSWSWASLDCQVKLPYYDETIDFRDFDVVDNPMDGVINPFSYFPVEWHGVNVKLVAEDTCGMVQSGEIRVTCRLFTITRDTQGHFHLQEETRSQSSVHKPEIHWTWDEPDDNLKNAQGGPASSLTSFCFLPLHHDSAKNTHGIILECTGDKAGQYRRVGHLKASKGSFNERLGLKVSSRGTSNEKWPSHETFDEIKGFTITLV